MRILPRFLSCFFLILVSLWAVPAGSQDVPAIESLEIALWPEYDRSAVLVIYRARLAPDTILPTTLSLPIPSGLGEPHAVAMWFPDGSLNDQVEWKQQIENQQATVVVQTDTTGIWIEFYADLTVDGQGRRYTFAWPGGIEIGSFTYEVQHPIGASDLQISPFAEVVLGEDGMTYSRAELGSKDSSFELEIELLYNKSTSIRDPLEVLSQPLERLEVALWPEWDQSAVLVFYRAQLPVDTPLPTTVSFPIPTEVGDPYVVAKLYPDGSLDDRVEWRRQVDGEWATVSVQTDALGVWMEYYAQLTFDAQNRNYSFIWPGGIELGAFAFEVQQPTGATFMQVTPHGSTQRGDNGILYYRVELGSQPAGTTIPINLTYDNPSSELSEGSLSPGLSLARPEFTQGSTPDLGVILPWMLGSFGFILLSVGIFLQLRSRGEKARSATSPGLQRSKKRRAKKSDREIDASPVFCHICGTPANVSDHFCRRCGTQLRR